MERSSIEQFASNSQQIKELIECSKNSSKVLDSFNKARNEFLSNLEAPLGKENIPLKKHNYNTNNRDSI